MPILRENINISIALDNKNINIKGSDKKKDLINILSCLINSTIESEIEWESAKIEINKK